MKKVFSEEILQERIKKLQKRMLEGGISAALIKQNVDLFYFSGTMQDSYLLVPAEGEAVLMVRRNTERVREESGLKNIISIKSMRQIPALAHAFGCRFNSLGIESDVLPAKMYLFLQGLFPNVKLQDISQDIRIVRSIKDPLEIAWMRHAAAQLDQVMKKVPEFLVPGMTELELAAELEYRLRLAGHQGYMRMRTWNQEIHFGHVLSGPDGAVPSYFLGTTGGIGMPGFSHGASEKEILPGEPLSIDFGGCVNGYMIDQTRMFALGSLPEELKKAFDAVMEIHYGLRKLIKVGETCGSVYEWATEKAAQKGYGDYFLGFGDSKMEFVGHGIGLEVDELPVLSKGNMMLLEPGMVFAVEPKFIFPGVGHIGIEDTCLLTESGLEPITVSYDGLTILNS